MNDAFSFVAEALNGSTIVGLRFDDLWFAPNGGESRVVPFPTTRPVNIVFHGEVDFKYGQYGIHLGQEDRLVFLGDASSEISAFFVDCRRASKTCGVAVRVRFKPSSTRILCIPPGVAHTFEGLESIFTINSYNLYLPSPDDWVSGASRWNWEHDIINMPLDTPEVVLVDENREPASDLFYTLLGQVQRNALGANTHMHGETRRVEFEDGTAHDILFRAPVGPNSGPDLSLEVGISGVKWSAHPALSTGEHSGICALTDQRPFYVVDHGAHPYAHDAYGIHLGQEDNLTFLGSSDQIVSLTLVDCRAGSPTLHLKQHLVFYPDSRRYLTIPNGVAHAFSGLENVYTLNRPVVRIRDWRKYDSANDVIDWPIESKTFPVLAIDFDEAPPEFYHAQALRQSEKTSGKQSSTPIVFLATDSSGLTKRVSLSRQ